jgi:hypothetical protein
MPITKKSALLFASFLLLYANALAQNSEKPVKIKDLPAAVQATVKQQSKGATIRGLSKEVEDGKTFYEVELKVSGHNKDVLIDPAGAVVTIEEEVTLDSLPSAARAEIEKQAANGKIQMVESITENDHVVAYEAHIRAGKKSLEVKVSPDGQLIATESDANEVKGRAIGKKATQRAKKP